uniref:Uncharacterized protein n=1 Tax=Rhizophora mucronata TaxID=61149 RepID=A0A2P2NB34_RHIMU
MFKEQAQLKFDSSQLVAVTNIGINVS